MTTAGGYSMTTTSGQMKCPLCPETFAYQGQAYYRHMRSQHPTPGQKAADTRARNKQAKNAARQDATKRMKASSIPVIQRQSFWKGEYEYYLRLSYEVDLTEYSAPHLRVPSPGALQDIKSAEERVKVAEQELARTMQRAFDGGRPLTTQEVEVARAAGEAAP